MLLRSAAANKSWPHRELEAKFPRGFCLVAVQKAETEHSLRLETWSQSRPRQQLYLELGLKLLPVRALTEGGTYLVGKLFQREGFLQEIRFDVDHFVVEHGLSRIAGDEQKLGIRPHLRKFCRQLPTAHVRHDHVRRSEEH